MALQSLSIPFVSAPPEADPVYASLAESARMEFQAALQLLADRAAFVTGATGVAIAIEEGGAFRYRVATGSGVAEPETLAGTDDQNLQKCLCEAVPVRVIAGGMYKLIVPVQQNEKSVGFMEVAGRNEFMGPDAETVARLADLASVALEHLEAAENADAHFWERLQEPVTPKLWHAPEQAGPEPAKHRAESVSRAVAEVHLCSGCGFPVSAGRTLCVECEQKPAAAAVAPGELFATQPHANWFSEHGYTLASLLVSALAAAVIFWLKR